MLQSHTSLALRKCPAMEGKSNVAGSACTSSTEEIEAGDHNFKASLGYTPRDCKNEIKTTMNKDIHILRCSCMWTLQRVAAQPVAPQSFPFIELQGGET